jgi:hypothetical protein
MIAYCWGCMRYFRGRREMDQGDESFVRARVEPLAARLGVEPGMILISPMLQGWA